MTTARVPAIDRLTIPTSDTLSIEPMQRIFKMLAYTGAIVERWYGRMVIDLAGLDVGSKKKPILLNHDPDRRVGFTESIVKTSDKLELSGKLLDNADGQAVLRDSAAGFPWQASVGLSFGRVEELLSPSDVRTVNGREVRGPCMVATKSTLLESSFVALGADGDTSAEALVSLQKCMPWLEVAEDEMSDIERAKAIANAFPLHSSFALEHILSGSTLEQAHIAFAAVLAKDNETLRSELAKKTTQFVPFNAQARSDITSAQDPKPSDLPPKERSEAEFKQSADIRKAFGTVGAYEAYLRADAEGRVKIYEKFTAAS